MTEERRKNPRFVVDVPVQVMAGGATAKGRLRDICRDAALVEAETPQPLESTVTLLLELPGTGGPIRVVGRVIRLASAEEGRHGAAILFTDVPPATEARIDFFVALQEGKAG